MSVRQFSQLTCAGSPVPHGSVDPQRMRDGVLEAAPQGPEAVVQLVVRLVAALTTPLEGVAARLAALAAELQRACEARSEALLAAGLQATPPPVPTGQRGRPPRGQAGRLGDRLRAHQRATLACMEGLALPLDHHQAQRDLRMTKGCAQRSGCFRTLTGAHRCWRSRGSISTLRQHGLPLLPPLGEAMVRAPPLPAAAQRGSPG